MVDASSLFTVDVPTRALLERHAAWWRRSGALVAAVEATPLGQLWLPLAGGADATEDVDLTPAMLDLDRLAGPALAPGPLEQTGDLLRTAAPYTRVPWVEAILGAPVRATLQGGSMRTHAVARSWEEWAARDHRPDAGWLDALAALTAMLAARSGGRHATVQTLMRGPSDLAEALLGPELMSLSLFDAPRELAAFLEHATAVFIDVLRAQEARIPRLAGGVVTMYGIWAPGTVVRTQCDASAFLSPRHYAQVFLPYDEQISRAAGYSLIHLHSCSLHTVPALLERERPHAIQITYETFSNGPSLQALLPVLRQILAAKPLIFDGPLTDAEVRWLLDRLPPDGLCIIARQSPW